MAVHDWHIPYHQQALTLQAALTSLREVTAASPETPLMLQWIKQSTNGQDFGRWIAGSLDQHQHDCIQIVLGRGLSPTDEAFGFGFTLGSACKGTMPEQVLHANISRHLQAMLSTLHERDLDVFREGVKMAYICGCVAMDRFEFSDWLDQPLRVIRDAIGLEPDILLAYYAVEQRRYPQHHACARLLPPASQVVAF